MHRPVGDSGALRSAEGVGPGRVSGPTAGDTAQRPGDPDDHPRAHLGARGRSEAIASAAIRRVPIFLFLSGYGLGASCRGRCPPWREFLLKRTGRIFIPYWLATVVIVVLDAVLLERTYSMDTVVRTFLGVNLDPATQCLDYARWFITLILLWYLLFYLAMRLQSATGIGAHGTLLCCGAGLFLLDYYILPFSLGRHFLAFPAGCALAHLVQSKGDNISRHARRPLPAIGLLALVLLFNAFARRLFSGGSPAIALQFCSEVRGLLLTVSLAMLLWSLRCRRLSPRSLTLFGLLSYELFLLHGSLLIKYNPVFGHLPGHLLPLSFGLILGLSLVLSLVFQKLHRVIHVRQRK